MSNHPITTTTTTTNIKESKATMEPIGLLPESLSQNLRMSTEDALASFQLDDSEIPNHTNSNEKEQVMQNIQPGFIGMVATSLIEMATQKEIPWAPKIHDKDSQQACAMRESILRDGQKDPILVYLAPGMRKLVAVDGRNRLQAMRDLSKTDIWAKVTTQEEAYDLARATYINREPSEVSKAKFIHDVAQKFKGKVPKGKTLSEAVSEHLGAKFGWDAGYGSKNVQKYIECGQFIHEAPRYENDPNFTSCSSINELRKVVQETKEAVSGNEVKVSEPKDGHADKRKGPAATVNRSVSSCVRQLKESKAAIIANPVCAYNLLRLHAEISRLLSEREFKEAAEKGRSEAGDSETEDGIGAKQKHSMATP